MNLDLRDGEADLGAVGPFRVVALDPRRIKLLEKNARYMPPEMFRRLVKNVAADGGLSSAVYCWVLPDGEPEALSGNHRTQAAVEAGIDLVPVLVDERSLTRDEAIARQLSHNAIDGSDDMVILKELWEEMGDLEAKEYAGLDDRTLGELAKVNLDGLSEVGLDYRSVTFLFLPDELERVAAAFDQARRMLSLDHVFLARLDEYEKLLTDLARAQGAHDVRNSAVGMMLVLDIFERHLTDLAEGWDGPDAAAHKGWVPLASIFGTDEVPAASAVVIKRAVERMVGRDEVPVKAAWQAIELLAADYLAQ